MLQTPFNGIKHHIGILLFFCLIPLSIHRAVGNKLSEEQADVVTRGGQGGVKRAWDDHLYQWRF